MDEEATTTPRTDPTSTRSREIPPEQVMIQFGTKVKEALREIDRLTQTDDRFDYDVRELLKTLTGKAPVPVMSAMTRLALVVRETAQFQEKTPVEGLDRALSNLIGQVMGASDEKASFKVTENPRLPSLKI